MSIIELILIGLGLAMDCLAVSVSCGVTNPRLSFKQGLRIAIFFALFQAGMSLLGWLFGWSFRDLISAIDHWIAFGILGFIGGKMIYESLSVSPRKCINPDKIMVLLGLSLATSIDALIVGMSFAFLNVRILQAAIIIGIVTFFVTMSGGYFGKRFGYIFGKRAELAGGLVLIAIGIKILIEHIYYQ